MKQLNYLALIALSAMPHLASSMAPPQRRASYTWATILNRTGGPIRVTYFRPDPGFYGMHVIVQDTQTLANEAGARIMVTRNNITAPRCVYQIPDETGEYQLFRTDSVAITIDPTADNQTISLGEQEAG